MRRSTGIYILLLVILAGLYYYLNNRPQKIEDQNAVIDTPESVEYLFNPSDGLPSLIRVESGTGEIVEVARNADNAWALTKPIEATADQGPVEAAAGQATTIRVLDHIPDLSKDAVGLDNPVYKITIQFTNNVERIVNIGVLTPTGNGYYANRGDGSIMIVSNTGLDTLIGFLTNPPYLATLTPPPPSTQADSTPESATTPQP